MAAPTSRVLLLDIETSQILGWTFGPTWRARIVEVERDPFVMSVSWSWLGEKKVHGRALPDYKATYRRDPHDDKALVKETHALLTQAADEHAVVVAHNGDNFDIKVLRAQMMHAKLRPTPPIRTVDTLKWARRFFRFTSNRLDALCEYLGLGRKHPVDKELWLRCLRRDERAWRKMTRYNKHDVVLLKRLYLTLRAWSGTSHPRVDHHADSPACRVCGSTLVWFKGLTANLRKRRIHCQTCFAWSDAPL
jgi:RNase_H superfamily